MAVPTITSIEPAFGPPWGKQRVTITGTGFRLPTPPAVVVGPATPAPPSVRVLVGGETPAQVNVLSDTRIDILTRPRLMVDPEGRALPGPLSLDVSVSNVDDAQVPIPGELVELEDGYEVRRYDAGNGTPAMDAVLVAALLDWFRTMVCPNTNWVSHTEFDDSPFDGENVTFLAQLPAVTLTGPRTLSNRLFSSNDPTLFRDDLSGVLSEVKSKRTEDIAYDVTIVSDNGTEFLNLITAARTVIFDTPYFEWTYEGTKYRHEFGLTPTLDGITVDKQGGQLNSDINVARLEIVLVGVPIARLPGYDRVGDLGEVPELGPQGVTLEGDGIGAIDLSLAAQGLLDANQSQLIRPNPGPPVPVAPLVQGGATRQGVPSFTGAGVVAGSGQGGLFTQGGSMTQGASTRADASKTTGTTTADAHAVPVRNPPCPKPEETP